VLDGQSGTLNERVVEFDPNIWKAMEERGRAILKSTPEDLPPAAFEPERAQNGKMQLELRCRYCQYKHHCWPGAQLALRGNKPSWYIKEQSDV